MNKTSRVIIGVIVVVIISGVAYVSVNEDDVMMEARMEETSTMESKDTAMEDDGDIVINHEKEMMKSGFYEVYTPEKLARAETGDVVLFFHASWCPSCRGLSADIEKNLSAIPSEVSILKVDYDTESELRRKYEVTYQHTLVQVSADGTMIKKWSGSPTLNSLVSQIN